MFSIHPVQTNTQKLNFRPKYLQALVTAEALNKFV